MNAPAFLPAVSAKKKEEKRKKKPGSMLEITAAARLQSALTLAQSEDSRKHERPLQDF